MFLDEMAAGEPQRPWPKWLIHIPTIYHEFDFSRRQRQSSRFCREHLAIGLPNVPGRFCQKVPGHFGKKLIYRERHCRDILRRGMHAQLHMHGGMSCVAAS